MIGCLTRITRQRTVRLISHARHKPPVLEALAPTFGARDSLEQLESVTSGRVIAQQKGVPGIAPSAFAAGYGYTYVNAAIAYTRLDGNRFNPRDWGAWYCGFDVETSLAEVSYHLTRAIRAAGDDFDNTTSYVELLADFDAEFVDIRNVEPVPACLDADVAIGYPNGQALASEARQAGLNGIVYPSVRSPGGTCLAAFWPGLLQNFQQGQIWTLKWEGSPTPQITKGLPI